MIDYVTAKVKALYPENQTLRTNVLKAVMGMLPLRLDWKRESGSPVTWTFKNYGRRSRMWQMKNGRWCCESFPDFIQIVDNYVDGRNTLEAVALWRIVLIKIMDDPSFPFPAGPRQIDVFGWM